MFIQHLDEAEKTIILRVPRFILDRNALINPSQFYTQHVESIVILSAKTLFFSSI